RLGPDVRPGAQGGRTPDRRRVDASAGQSQHTLSTEAERAAEAFAPSPLDLRSAASRVHSPGVPVGKTPRPTLEEGAQAFLSLVTCAEAGGDPCRLLAGRALTDQALRLAYRLGARRRQLRDYAVHPVIEVRGDLGDEPD